MHLFIVHQFPDFDNFVPVIIDLKKKTKQDFSMMNIFPVHDLKYYRLDKLLNNYGVQLIDISEINIKSKLISFFLKLLKIIPKYILEKLDRGWYYFYHKFILFDKNHLVSLIKRRQIKSINIDKALPDTYKKIIFLACKKTKIKMNCYNLGIEMRKNIKINHNDYDLFDYGIIQDQNLIIEESDKKIHKIIRTASSRYSLRWINEVENVYKYKLKDYSPIIKNRRLKILLVTRPFFSEKSWKMIHEELKKIESIDLRIKFKPRGQFKPLHIQNNIVKELNTSELINWADVVVAHSSSILVEAIIKYKKILFLNFLFDLEKKNKIRYIFENQPIVEYVNSINDLREKIHDVKSNRDEITVPDEYENSREYFLRKNLDQEFFHEHACLNKDLVEIYSR